MTLEIVKDIGPSEMEFQLKILQTGIKHRRVIPPALSLLVLIPVHLVASPVMNKATAIGTRIIQP